MGQNLTREKNAKTESRNWDYTAGARFVPNRSASPSLITLKASEPRPSGSALRVGATRTPLKTSTGLPQKSAGKNNFFIRKPGNQEFFPTVLEFLVSS